MELIFAAVNISYVESHQFRQIVPPTHLYWHEEWNSRGIWDNDIGLIRTVEPVEFSGELLPCGVSCVISHSLLFLFGKILSDCALLLVRRMDMANHIASMV